MLIPSKTTDVLLNIKSLLLSKINNYETSLPIGFTSDVNKQVNL